MDISIMKGACGRYKLTCSLEVYSSRPVNGSYAVVISTRSNIRIQLPVVKLKQLSQLISSNARLFSGFRATVQRDPFCS